ncbi:hypothetical protein Tco_1491204 [Tanacetum coccineum]
MGVRTNHGQTLVYRLNLLQLCIIVNPLIIKLDVQNGLPVAGEKMDIVMEETYQEIVGNTLRYQDLEWYDALKDSELKEEALRNKAIMEGLIDDDVELNYKGWKSWDDFENTNGDRKEREWEYEHEDKERYELFDNHKLLVCNIRRFEMIKYSFGDDEEYVVVKEDEYDDLTSTSKDACRAYQEIFRMMDEGWMDLAEKKSTMLVENLRSGNLEVLES